MSILDELAPEPNWREQALCARLDTDPDDWFPSPRHGPVVADPAARNLAETCGHCPVRETCLALALAYEAGQPREYRFGIWGGKTPRQRAAMDPGRRPVGGQVDSTSCPEPGKGRGLERHARLDQEPCPPCAAYEREQDARIERDELFLRLADDGATAWQISLTTGISYGTVYGVLVRHGRTKAKPVRLAPASTECAP